MFVDYYALLEIKSSATFDEIKSAFKNQALKWHPDRNPSIDTTKRMQQINEAYLILKDSEARGRYDEEYRAYIEYIREKEHVFTEKEKSSTYERSDFEDDSYTIHDEILRKWVENAKRQAVDLAKQTIEDLKGMVKVGVKEAAKEAGGQFIAQLVISIVILIVFSVIGLCSHN